MFSLLFSLAFLPLLLVDQSFAKVVELKAFHAISKWSTPLEETFRTSQPHLGAITLISRVNGTEKLFEASWESADQQQLESIPVTDDLIYRVAINPASQDSMFYAHLPLRKCPDGKSKEKRGNTQLKLNLHVNEQSESVYHIDLEKDSTDFCIETTEQLTKTALNMRLTAKTASVGKTPVLEQRKMINGQDAQQKDGGKAEEQTFIQKYWIYIVIFFVVSMLGGGGNPDQQQQQQQQRGRGQVDRR